MTAPRPELSEKDFISDEGYKKNPFPFWLWIFLLAAISAIVLGGNGWYQDKLASIFKANPFLQVTNREMSLFLWQNPEFMRVNSKQKVGYLPDFQYLEKISVDPSRADNYVVAPPEIIFRYHTWKRLISGEFISRPIPIQEFRDFINYAQEWQPTYWPAAPEEYAAMIESLATSQIQDLSILSVRALPQSVRMAFQGWKNYFKEGEAINHLQLTVAQVEEFLKDHPPYARNFWRNVVEDRYPDYLRLLMISHPDEASSFPKDQLTPFLKVAIYNFLESKKTSSSANKNEKNSLEQ